MNANEEVVQSTETEVVPEKSKGQLFKEQFGYSKTMKRNMKKYGLSTPAEYRALRKKNKKSGKFRTPKRPKVKAETQKPKGR